MQPCPSEGMDTKPTYDIVVRRAAMPEILLAADIALALGIREQEAETATLKGHFGPSFLVRGRCAVLKRTLLDSLALRSASALKSRKEVLP